MLAEYSNVVLERTRTLWWNVRAKNGKRRREMVERPAKKRVRNRTNNRIESFTKVGGEIVKIVLRRNEKSWGSPFLYEVFFISVTIAHGRVPRMITWRLSK